MTATITINYQGATFSANTASITVGNGGTFELDTNEFLQLNGTFTFNSLNISSGTIEFYNQSAGTSVNGTVVIPVAKGGGDPTITATNFQGAVTVNWPSTSGPQYEQMSSGEQISLTNFTG